jgi:predicted protein tyrosine phosphatase
MDASDITEIVQVTCLPKAAQVATEWNAKLVCSLLDPSLPLTDHPKIADAEHVVCILLDQERADATGAFEELLIPVIEKVDQHLRSDAPRLLVHCHAGVSRSTGMAYGAIAMLLGEGREVEAFDQLMTITRKPWPNRRVVEVVDAYLGRNGALLAPLDAMRAQYPMRLEHYRRFNRRRGLVSKYQR